MNIFNEIHFVYGRVGALKFVLPIVKTCKGESIIYCQEGNDNCSETDKRIIILPSWFNMKISLEYKFIVYFIPSCIYLYYLLSKNKQSKFIVHMNTFALFPLIIAKLAGVKKRIYFNHGFPFIGATFLMKIIFYVIEFLNVYFSTQIITVSPKQLEKLKNNFITKLKPIKPIMPGSCCGISKSRIINLKDLKRKQSSLISNKNKIYITYIGRPLIRKGFPYVIKVFESLKEKLPNKNLMLQVIGVDEKTVYSALKDKSKIKSIISIKYTNNVDYFLNKSHITVLPSTRESFGYAFLEGAAKGNALAMFNICGPDCLVIENFNGVVVKSKSEYYKFAESLAEIIKNPKKLMKMMDNARESSFKFDQRKVLKSVRDNI